jgi:hypothetical protein
MPDEWDFRDWPVEAVCLNEQFDAIGKANLRLNRDLLDDPPAKQAQSVARITGWHAGNMVSEERRRGYQHRLEKRTPFHPSTRHESTR